MNKFSFNASLPPIQSAISVSGQGDGARIKLDIPQRDSMIEKIDGRYRLFCDICGEPVDREFDDFYYAIVYKKENDWKSQKYKGEWEDVCPECQEG